MASIRTAGLTKDFGELRAVIDRTREDFADGQRRYDVILDVGGASTLSRLRCALAPTGRLVIVGSETGGRLLGGFGRTLRAPLLSPFVSRDMADPGSARRTTRTCSS